MMLLQSRLALKFQHIKRNYHSAQEESYLMLVDRHGKWRVNTMIKGFDTHVKGFASSYSNTGDIILIGKSIEDMKQAFNEIKKMNGGIVLVENGEVIVSIPLTIAGTMYDGKVEALNRNRS